MADCTAYFNGEWVPYSQVLLSPEDRGFMGGDVVFDVERTFNGKSFRMKQHIDRLYRSLKYVRIDPGLSAEEMVDISEEVIRRNEDQRAEVGDFSIMQFVTRGPRGEGARPTVCVRVVGMDFRSYARFCNKGVPGVITRTRSYPVESLDSKVKHFSRMNFALARLEAEDVDPDAWPILTDADGNLTEGVGFNVFLVTDGVLRTAGNQTILKGVSREMVFDLARQLDIPVAAEDLQPYDLYTADEVFFSSTPLACCR